MAAKIVNYYAGGNTARGFYSLYDSNIEDLAKFFILKGGSGTGKSTIMKNIGGAFAEKGFEVEYWHCASNNNTIEGVKIPAIKVGIVNETVSQTIESKTIRDIVKCIDVSEAWDSTQIVKQKEKLLLLSQQASEANQTAYKLFFEALKVHDEWEKIYIENMDFAKANECTEQLIKQLFGENRKMGKSKVVHRFLGAATPKGAVDFVPNLTEGTPNRFLIKGRPGSGKSTILKKLVTHAKDCGFDVEVYHCGFDPNSLDMVIVRELGFSIFDSTAPHEYFPSRKGDKIIDMYANLITPGTDERYAKEIVGVSKRYKEKMQEAISYLAKAKSFNSECEAIYNPAFHLDKLNHLIEELKMALFEKSSK